MDFTDGSVVKNATANARDARDTGLILGKIPWRRKRQPTPVFLPGKFQGQRSLAGIIVHGVAKSRTRLDAHTHTHTHTGT